MPLDGHALVCSAIAGVLATGITHPFDTAAVMLGTGRKLPPAAEPPPAAS